MCKIFDKIQVPAPIRGFEVCHRLNRLDGKKKVIVKFSRRNDFNKVKLKYPELSDRPLESLIEGGWNRGRILENLIAGVGWIKFSLIG